MENLWQKIPFTQCASLMCALLSLPVRSCLSLQHVHTIKWLIVPKLLCFRRPNGICIFTLCYVFQHHILWIKSRCVRWEQWVLWSIALLMNQDESMLCDLERKGKTTVLEGVTHIVCVIVVAFQGVSHCFMLMHRMLMQSNLFSEKDCVRYIWPCSSCCSAVDIAALHTTTVRVHTETEPVNSEVKVQEVGKAVNNYLESHPFPFSISCFENLGFVCSVPQVWCRVDISLLLCTQWRCKPQFSNLKSVLFACELEEERCNLTVRTVLRC